MARGRARWRGGAATAAVVAVVATVTPAGPASAHPPVLAASFASPGGQPLMRFGSAVSVSVGTAVVGSGGSSSVLVFEKTGSTWSTTPAATLDDPSTGPSHQFGSAVSVSGTSLVVGAPGEGPGGTAYVYTQTGGVWPAQPTVTLTDPRATPGDGFGSAVAVSGSTAVVGADLTGSRAGAAYLYTATAGTWSTTPVPLVDPGGAPGDEFGSGVAVSSATALVAADAAAGGNGSAFLYGQTHRQWSPDPVATLADPGGPSAAFGFSVALGRGDAVVGAPNAGAGGAAYLYTELHGVWPVTPSVTLADPGAAPGDDFGWSSALSGSRAVVGSLFGSAGTGAAAVFTRAAGVWGPTASAAVADPSPAANDEFGASVAVAGSAALCGAPGAALQAGKAYLYSL
ncbi:MAG TPA: FG-GAP repeat protein [Acidimicrobiales bacterium]|nr:FG-GAP repeat protein [Acidimicrobiales bacterium]